MDINWFTIDPKLSIFSFYLSLESTMDRVIFEHVHLKHNSHDLNFNRPIGLDKQNFWA